MIEVCCEYLSVWWIWLFESSCRHLNFRFRVWFEWGVPWHSGNYRVSIQSEKRTWNDKNILSNFGFKNAEWHFRYTDYSEIGVLFLFHQKSWKFVHWKLKNSHLKIWKLVKQQVSSIKFFQKLFLKRFYHKCWATF